MEAPGNRQMSVDTFSSGQEALDRAGGGDYSVLITDLRMPGMGGMELIREVAERRVLVTTIVTTAFGSIDRVVEAMRLGAYDFLTKPIDPTNLKLVMDRALKKRALQDEVLRLRQQLKENYSFHNIISKNPKMHAIFELVRHIAGTRSTVLIEGETGTGKELIAKAVHYSNEERQGPLVAINCAALPESLLESELFGHERGRVHLGRRQAQGAVRAGGQGDDLPRRDRRHLAGDAGQAPPGPPGAQVRAGRRAREHRGRHPRRGRDRTRTSRRRSRRGGSARTSSTGST
jgi:DNA-binding NtrC family response regulator